MRERQDCEAKALRLGFVNDAARASCLLFKRLAVVVAGLNNRLVRFQQFSVSRMQVHRLDVVEAARRGVPSQSQHVHHTHSGTPPGAHPSMSPLHVHGIGEVRHGSSLPPTPQTPKTVIGRLRSWAKNKK